MIQKILGRLGGSLVGARRFPIEDVPADAFDRVIPREVAPRAGQIELIERVLALYAPSAPPLRFKRARPRGAGVFGGRWLPHARGIVVWAHHDPLIERAVTIHEVCHYLRSFYGHDTPGHHDDAFLAMVEDAYRTFGIPVQVAKLVEGEYPTGWKW